MKLLLVLLSIFALTSVAVCDPVDAIDSQPIHLIDPTAPIKGLPPVLQGGSVETIAKLHDFIVTAPVKGFPTLPPIFF